ncbi:MAG: amidohydrolase [Salinibacter sp.]
MASETPELVLHNAQIYTVDDRCPTATALAVRDERFSAVGSDEELLSAFPDAPRIDAKGQTVVPGFIDAHAHLVELGYSLGRADLAGAASAEAVVETLKAFASERDLPDGVWLRGHGWDETRWPRSDAPHRNLLDAAFPERPVWLTRTDVHAGWANTAALDATVGLDRLRRMSNPDGGRIARNADGAPTGILVDTAMELVEKSLPPPTDAQRDRALSAALNHTAQHGITGLHDAGVDLTTIRHFKRRIEEDEFPLRVYAMIDGREAAFDHFCEHGPLHHPSGRLDVESVKFFADGALGSRGAALLDDYADDPGNRGLLLYDRDDFQRDVEAAVECGFQVNTHAIGDRANRMVLNVYEAATRECRVPLRRPRIEHAQVVAPRDRARFGDLGVIASVQPAFAPSDRAWAPNRLGSSRADRAYAWASLHDAGAALAFGSDAPVEPISPLRGLLAAVARPGDSESPDEEWSPSDPLDRTTALRAYTLGGAYAAFREPELGSISPGKRADFVVLSQDLMSVPASHLPDTEIVATYIDGTPVYTRDDWPNG